MMLRLMVRSCRTTAPSTQLNRLSKYGLKHQFSFCRFRVQQLVFDSISETTKGRTEGTLDQGLGLGFRDRRNIGCRGELHRIHWPGMDSMQSTATQPPQPYLNPQ